MRERKVADKELRQLAAWERFLETERGCYPSAIAAIKLGMTTSGVYNAAQRGYIAFFQIGRDRWYSRRDVLLYRENVSRKFRCYRLQPAASPKNLSALESLPEGTKKPGSGRKPGLKTEPEFDGNGWPWWKK